MTARARMPAVSLVAYEAPVIGMVFVKVPNELGRWVLTHRCVVLVECPHCGAVVGEPCKRKSGNYGVGTHFRRRALALERYGRNPELPKLRISTDDFTPGEP